MAADVSHFEYDGFAEIDEKLKRMALDNADLRDYVKKATWKVLAQVRRAAQQNANFKNSRHNSIASIRRTIYRKILGGNVSILDGKRRGRIKSKGSSSRTQQINSYAGKDRGFILRFVNSGTDSRFAGSGRNRNLSREFIRSQVGKPGYRGEIAPRNFFAPAATSAIQGAAEQLAQMIEEEIEKQFNNG